MSDPFYDVMETLDFIFEDGLFKHGRLAVFRLNGTDNTIVYTAGKAEGTYEYESIDALCSFLLLVKDENGFYAAPNLSLSRPPHA